MNTFETAQEIGTVKQDKTIERIIKRNTPTYLENAISTLIYYNEGSFQYKKDIQIEACIKGHIVLRDSQHIKKYKEIMDKVEYGNNPDIHITSEQRAQKDNFSFTGSRVKTLCSFQISSKTKHELEGLSQRIDMDINDIDFMAYTIGYQEMLSSIPLSVSLCCSSEGLVPKKSAKFCIDTSPSTGRTFKVTCVFSSVILHL